MFIERVPDYPDPSADLEQYPTPAPIAAEILYYCAAHGDIANRRILDLGCGTGVFTVGAALLGARSVCGFDRSPAAVVAAKRFASAYDLDRDLDLIVMDIDHSPLFIDERGPFDTALQNPPFGAQKKHADRVFLQTALRCATVVYTLHLTRTRNFIHQFVKSHGKRVTAEERFRFPIWHRFQFHTAAVKYFDVSLFRIAPPSTS